MDTNTFEGEMKKQGLSKDCLAKKLGISYTALQKKISSRTQFKLDEIKRIQEIMKLSKEQRDEIFFNN